MANLLYVEYKTGCYIGWYTGDYEYAGYCYGYETVLASYYADLEPNTTYTIQRIDNSTRFRIALTSTDVKYYASSSGTTAEVFSWGYKADSSNPVTFTTTATATHLVVYYTNNSEYNTRVMLNEGSSIEPYEAPTRKFKKYWQLVDDVLIHDELPEPIDEALSEPYPASLWRLDSDNILTLNSEDWTPFPEPMEYLTPPYPATMWYIGTDYDLKNALLPEPTLKAFTYPYPASLWYLEDEDLILLNIFLPDEILIPPEPEGGAFYNAESLEYVKIPRTVTSIGVESFKGTNLKKVCISRNCKYYNTSFPSDCQIIFYEDMYDEQYQITVSGKNSYRYTDTITHDEESTISETP